MRKIDIRHLAGSTGQLSRLSFTHKRYKPDRHQRPAFKFALLVLFNQHQRLGGQGAADRYHHSASRRKLLKQRRWNLPGGGSHDNGIKGRIFGPAEVSVAGLRIDNAVSEAAEFFVGTGG